MMLLFRNKYLSKGNIYYKQLLDLAKEERDNALNYLSTITKSLTANMAIITDAEGINQIEQEKLLIGVRRLKNVLDQYIFEIMNSYYFSIYVYFVN